MNNPRRNEQNRDDDLAKSLIKKYSILQQQAHIWTRVSNFLLYIALCYVFFSDFVYNRFVSFLVVVLVSIFIKEYAYLWKLESQEGVEYEEDEQPEEENFPDHMEKKIEEKLKSVEKAEFNSLFMGCLVSSTSISDLNSLHNPPCIWTYRGYNFNHFFYYCLWGILLIWPCTVFQLCTDLEVNENCKHPEAQEYSVQNVRRIRSKIRGLHTIIKLKIKFFIGYFLLFVSFSIPSFIFFTLRMGYDKCAKQE
ncbi:hypothetical protein L3Y34_002349 [Caenorhabditis briggsae]|uniref:Uncharacterized protein n=1 Tax=Caenorhabditis briggsae TaxID=6238 RepID=A0AAE9IRD0_CAEBR|nr:hypothetical protein L3Y34_002349 [Caenorhabditis briggsae]